MTTDTETVEEKKRVVLHHGIGEDSVTLGCSREHLYRVLTGKRTSRSLLTRYAKLKGKPVPTVKPVVPLKFGDAVRIARGCLDYSGGHHHDGQLDAFKHGVQTVINALEGAEKSGLNDTQAAALWRMGGKTNNEQKS